LIGKNVRAKILQNVLSFFQIFTDARNSASGEFGVARFLLLQLTKTGKIYQVTLKDTKKPYIKYARWP
jgi:hypothetical protein